MMPRPVIPPKARAENPNSPYADATPPPPTNNGGRLISSEVRGLLLKEVGWGGAEEKIMNAFKAYKACVPIAWSPNLYITLVRGIPGTRRLHRRTLEALRLGKCNRTVMRWNTPTVRGMLQQVKRLVVIETEEMFKARKEKEANHRALRPPLVISHGTGSAIPDVAPA
ncbi:hypothetical protein MLD38_014300 [Melastoma candidum]|uniref:Uncharacterized protein n=1 Tax=Melastoma candidum TaxID=119954 RepID=A0ACB9RKS5_9MYRT|nr:hypothetical protein MLD38_014300 [Melastoma candidum]